MKKYLSFSVSAEDAENSISLFKISLDSSPISESDIDSVFIFSSSGGFRLWKSQSVIETEDMLYEWKNGN